MSNVIQAYVFPRKFNGMFLPTFIQSQVIRSFVNVKKKIYGLHQSEFNFDNAYHVLYQVLKKKVDIAMCSCSMLPNDYKKLKEIIEIKHKNKKNFYFIFEKLEFTSDQKLEDKLFKLQILKNLNRMVLY